MSAEVGHVRSEIIESATELTVRWISTRWRWHTVRVPGHSRPVARLIRRDKSARKVLLHKWILTLTAGPIFWQRVIGYVGRIEAWTPDNVAIGSVGVQRDAEGVSGGHFDQNGLQRLHRRSIDPAGPEAAARAGAAATWSRRTRRAARKGQLECMVYDSPSCTGFTMVGEPGVEWRFIVHDDRIDRILLLSTYLADAVGDRDRKWQWWTSALFLILFVGMLVSQLLRIVTGIIHL